MPRVSDARQRLMEAMTSLIWENSYGATSVDAICEKAGVKKGSFYHFFESKSELALAALDENWACTKQRLDAAFSATLPPLERLAGFFESIVERQSELRGECGSVLGCPLFSLGVEVGTQDAALRARVKEILRSYLAYFESALREADARGDIRAPDAHGKAKVVFAFFQGTMAQARIQNDLALLRGLKDGVAELLGKPLRRESRGGLSLKSG